jgi:hypothetical protein
MSRPEVGWWLIKRGRNMPWVPARIFWCSHEPGEPSNLLDRWPLPFLSAEIAGKPVDTDEVWFRRGREITEAEFKFLMSERAWLRFYRPSDPVLHADKPINLRDVPLPFGDN